MQTQDSKTIFVLDAGGTTFKFTAISDWHEIITPFRLTSKKDTLEEILETIIEGFTEVQEKCGKKPDAISFCFPGPADYINGIIGDLQNLELFRGGVALKAMLEEKFQVPVYINNDGDLFAYGEALAGILPEVNKKFKEQGNPRRYNNLLGVTCGTGFGGGIVLDGILLKGDNSAGGEINRFRNFLFPSTSIEDSISIRAIERVYINESKIDVKDCPEPIDIYKIAIGEKNGNQKAAIKAWDDFAVALADAIANAVSLIDGIVVIGGGLSGAWPLFMPKLIESINKKFVGLDGKEFTRMEVDVFNLQDENSYASFTEKTGAMVDVPLSKSGKQVWYDPMKKIGIGITRLGTSSSVAIGAYSFALNELKKLNQ